MARIVASATAVPPHRISQDEAREAAARVYRGRHELERLLPVFGRTGVETRYLIRPLDWYAEERSFEERNAQYVEKGADLAEEAVRECLQKAKLPADRVDHVFFATTTGLATPSVDAMLAHRLAFRPDVKRTPIFGLGCAGGVAALARAADHCRAFPKQRALVVSLEVCSAVFSTRAGAPTDLVGAALFGDGAAALLLGGDEGSPRVLGARNHLFAGSQELMGWDFTNDGMRLVLSQEVPNLVKERLPEVVGGFLRDFGTPRHFVLHPGGPKILEAYRGAFGLDDAALEPIRRSLARHGNLSSAAVLFLLHELLASGRGRSGDRGLVVALGPGFAAEMVVLGW